MLNFPIQQIPESDKNKQWHRMHIDIFIQSLGVSNNFHLASKEDEYRNSNTYNAVFDPQSKKSITSPNGSLINLEYKVWPLARQKVRQLVSDFQARPMRKKVSTINKEAENRRAKHELDLSLEKALQEVNAEISEMLGFDVNDQESQEQLEIPDDISKYISMTYREAIEDQLQIGVDYLLYANKLSEVFKYGFIDAMTYFKSFFKVYIYDGDPYWRRIDPRNCFYDVPDNSEFLDDCQWFIEERWLTVNQIISEYPELTNLEIKQLQEMVTSGETSGSSWIDWKVGQGMRIRVVSMEWKSLMQTKVKISENKKNPNNPYYKKVKDDYKPRKSEKTISRVVDDIRKCTLIGNEIVTDWGRVENQVRSVDSPEKASLSYVGLIGDATSGEQHSLVKELEYLQDFASDILFTIKKTSMKLGKRALVYDFAQMPKQFAARKNPLESVLHHMGEDSIIGINSKDESNRGKQHSFNQFKDVNLSPSGDVNELINLFMVIEDLASKVSGVSPQREGQTEQYETGVNNRSAIIASTRRTEIYMRPYDALVQRVIERAINLTKIAWKDGKKARFFMGDGAMAVLNVMPDVELNDYGFYLGDGGKDLNMKDKIDAVATNYLQGANEPEMILQMIKVLKQDTADEAEQILEAGIQKMSEINEQRMQSEQESNEKVAKINAENDEKERDVKRDGFDKDITVAKINAGAKIDVAEIFSDDTRDTTAAKEKSKVLTEKYKSDNARAQKAKNNAISNVKR